MSLTTTLFKLIDYFGYLPQNTYHNKNSIKLLKDEIYCLKNQKNCTFDLYCDKNKKTTKQAVLVNLHGGGFVAGDKKYRKSFSEYCLTLNVKVININYSLAPTHNLTQILEELVCLFDWIKNNSEKYFIDMDKIILCGDSAGAYLAACLIALSTNNEYAKAINLPKIDTKIIGAVFFSGVYYPTDSLDKHMVLNINHSLWSYLCGEKFIDVETCKKHKLYNYINIGDFITNEFPPTFVSYSTTDIFCKGNGEKLISKFESLQIPYRAVHSKNAMHDWQENMFTKSAKRTLEHFSNYITDLLMENINKDNNSIIDL